MSAQDHYSQFLMKGPQGYAHHRVITDKEGKPINYVFLEVNVAFERLTGLNAKDVLNKKATEVIPGIEQNDFNWITFLGNVGLSGVEEEYEQFLAPLNKWFKGYAYSPQKGYFVTVFTDISPDRLISQASRKFMEHTTETPDYHYIVNTMQAISGAAYAVLNKFEPDGKDFTTKAITGHPKSIEKAARALGFSIKGKKWKHDPHREARIKRKKTTRFNCLRDLVGNSLPINITRLIEITFNIGECAIVKTSKGETTIGDFTLIYQKGQKLQNKAQLEIYADIVGMMFIKWEAEEKIKKASEQAQVASRAKSEFLANMSHEIRTPLNGVIGFTDLLKNTELTKLQQQYLDNANTSAHMLLGIISDILDLSKIESGKLELDPAKTDIIELAGQAIDIVKLRASAKGLEMLLDIQAGIPRFAEVDPIRLKQVLINLLGNAVKFTEKGEIELKLTFSEAGQGRGRFHFRVRDTGIGIEKARQDRLFESFYQADTSPTRRYTGAGLGLQISRLLINEMKGEIGFESDPGEGSSFFFHIETVYEPGEKHDQQAIKDIKRALVVDDNDSSRMILKHSLQNWGIECICSDSGTAALQLIRNTETVFDVIIIDYHMPGLDGLETIHLIRQDPARTPEKQAIVLLSSPADDSLMHEKCIALNGCFKLVKPVKPDELFNCLQHIKHNPELIEGRSKETEHRSERLASDGLAPVILLADDVLLNLVLIRTVLNSILPNALILEASNGKEAVDFVARESRIDLIFMDVQMPVMDGLEASRRIRMHEKRMGKRTPIIALTAGVAKEEKEKCLEAGMDGFLVKPLNQQRLRDILEKQLQMEVAVVEMSEKASIYADAHFDWNGLMERAQLPPATLMDLVKNSLTGIRNDLTGLKTAIESADAEKSQLMAHTIKGVALNMGFNRMSQLAEHAELTKDTNPVYFLELHQEMCKELDVLKTKVKEHMLRLPG